MVGLKNVSDFGILRGITKGEWIMVIVTSFFFGLAHYFSGSGWELGKITTAFIDGLALSLVYLIYGVYAPILLHWFRNYYFQVYSIASDVFPAFTPFYDLVVFLTLTFGLIALVIIAILGLKRIFRYQLNIN